VIAKKEGIKITPVAAEVTHKDSPPGYRSYGVVKSGSRIKSLADFRGKRVCFVDPASTSGYLFPRAGLLGIGIDPARDITPVFAGGHDASVLAVKNGQCEAGFAYDTLVDTQLIERRQIDPGEITTVWRSEIIPGAPWVVADGLSPTLRTQLTEALQKKANVDYLRANGFCQARCGDTSADAFGYVPTDDTYYDGVRRVCEITHDKSCST
jgi:phosphonate transport system substrate-binding protein